MFQASFEAVVREVVDEIDVQHVLKRIRDTAKERMKEEIPNDVRGHLQDVLDNNWCVNFKGKHHCESVTACLKTLPPKYASQQSETMAKKEQETLAVLSRKLMVGYLFLLACSPFANVCQGLSNHMGISKLCCHTCFYYVRIVLGDKVLLRGSFGRIFPWAVPPWENRLLVLQSLWEEASATEHDGLREPCRSDRSIED